MCLKSKYFIALFVVALFAAACGEGASEENTRKTEFEKMNIPLDQETSGIFAVTEEGELFSLREDGMLVYYAADGAIKNSYTGFEDAEALCVVGEKLYGCTGVQKSMVCMDFETGKTETLVSMATSEKEIENLVTANGKLYLLGSTMNLAGFHWTVVEYDLKTNNISELPFENVRAIYGAADGTLYYCAETGGQYSLFAYDADKKQGVLVHDLDENYAIRSLKAFVYEKNLLMYYSLEESALITIAVEDSTQARVDGTTYISSGKQLQSVAGNIVYHAYDGTAGGMHALYLPEQSFCEPKQVLQDQGDIQKETETVEKRTGTVTISTNSPMYIDSASLKAIGGVRAKLIQQNSFSDAFITDLMAGNPEVDIYIFKMTEKAAQVLKESGVYVPLNSSSIICEYRDKCFDYIGAEMTTESGDIWALPYSMTFDTIWYVPENLEKYSVTSADLADWKRYFAISEKFLQNTSIHAYTRDQLGLGVELWHQYDRTFCDFSRGEVDYQTELFREYFEKMWSKWLIYEANPCHPDLCAPSTSVAMESEAELYQKERVLFSYESLNKSALGYRMKQEGWRALPAPMLDNSVQGDTVYVDCAIINPYSENKELALWYLELVARNPGMLNPILPAFLFKDKAMYENIYDISIPAIQDLYEIAKVGGFAPMFYPYINNIILDYQEGRLTLDETINKIQRDTEMWLNE